MDSSMKMIIPFPPNAFRPSRCGRCLPAGLLAEGERSKRRRECAADAFLGGDFRGDFRPNLAGSPPFSSSRVMMSRGVPYRGKRGDKRRT
jgi:hypothetical protein